MAWPYVLLAAGRSTRMGTPKGLLAFRGRPWLAAQVEAIRAQGCDPCVVVGPGTPYLGLLAQLEVEIRLNPDPDRGPFYSLQVGLTGIDGPAFAGPLDVPVAPVLGALAAALGDRDAVVPTHGGRGGHPVLLGASWVRRLRDLDPEAPEARLDLQLRTAAAHRLEVEAPEILLNLNTPEAWQDYLAQP